MAAVQETSPTERYYKRFKLLESDRSSWDGHWKEISEYLLPISGRFLGGEERPNKGTKINDKIIDDTATYSIGILSAGMQGGLTSPARPWFRLAPSDPNMMENKAVRLWLETVRDRMLEVFSRSNFYDTIHSVYQELATFGTGVMHIEEDYDNVIRCRCYTVGEYYLALDKFYRVDTLYRVFWATAGQLVSRFGKENCSDSVVKMVENRQLDDWVKCCHVIEPRNDPDEKKGGKGMPWRSVYFEWGRNKDKLLGEGGYEEFPVVALRWNVTGSDVYGRGPGMDALGNVKMLQRMQSQSLIALEKQINPPMNAPSSMKGVDPISIRSGEVNFVNAGQGQQGLAPTFLTNFNIQQVEAKIQQVQMAIGRAFFNELFITPQFNDQRQRTATEIAAIQQEKMLRLGSVLERVQSEGLGPIIDRVFNIMQRHDILPTPPEELADMDLKVEYIDILAQAQKLSALTTVERVATFAANMMQAFPEVRHKFDAMQAIDVYAENAGVAPTIIRSDDEAKASQAAEQQQQQMAQGLAMAEQGAAAAQKLGQTPVGEAEQTLLDRMLGGGNGGVQQ